MLSNYSEQIQHFMDHCKTTQVKYCNIWNIRGRI